jgi:hypothetical protein
LLTPPDKNSLLLFNGMGINLDMTSKDLTGTLDLTVLTQDVQKVMKVDDHYSIRYNLDLKTVQKVPFTFVTKDNTSCSIK